MPVAYLNTTPAQRPSTGVTRTLLGNGPTGVLGRDTGPRRQTRKL